MKAILAAILLLISSCASPPEAKSTIFEDPVEHAFTIKVPPGWKAKGGTFRLGYLDARPVVETTGPSDAVSVRIGDYGIPAYVIPDRAHPQEGVMVDLEAQGQLGVARYRTGAEFALRYGAERFKNLCDKLEVVSHDPPIPFHFEPRTDALEESEGQVHYRCKSGNRELTAFVYARTTLWKPVAGVPRTWSAIALMSGLSTKAFLIGEVVWITSQSIHVTPEGVEHQRKMSQESLEVAQLIAQKKTQALPAQVEQFRVRMKAMSDQDAGFETQQNRQARPVEGFSDALSGIARTHDPLTGQYREVWSGQSNQYWVNGAGQVVSSANSPGPSFHQLQTVR